MDAAGPGRPFEPEAPPPRTVLVFGAGGQVGRALLAAVPPPGLRVAGLDRGAADITRPAAVARAVAAAAPAVVVNAAAYTAVDRAEADPEAAFAVNRDGAAVVARACAAAAVPLIHLSTDYVFGDALRGTAGAYAEDDPVAPLSVYGASKEAGERAVRDALEPHVILRTAWVYSPWGRNFVATMLRLGRERRILRVVADQQGCPTAAAEIARAVLAIAAQLAAGRGDAWGTVHFCGAGETTWHGFAAAIFAAAARFGAPIPVLRPITTADYPTPARRPARSVLDCRRIGALFGIVPRPWQTGLADCVAALCDQARSAAAQREVAQREAAGAGHPGRGEG